MRRVILLARALPAARTVACAQTKMGWIVGDAFLTSHYVRSGSIRCNHPMNPNTGGTSNAFNSACSSVTRPSFAPHRRPRRGVLAGRATSHVDKRGDHRQRPSETQGAVEKPAARKAPEQARREVMPGRWRLTCPAPERRAGNRRRTPRPMLPRLPGMRSNQGATRPQAPGSPREFATAAAARTEAMRPPISRSAKTGRVTSELPSNSRHLVLGSLNTERRDPVRTPPGSRCHNSRGCPRGCVRTLGADICGNRLPTARPLRSDRRNSTPRSWNLSRNAGGSD